MSKDDEDSPISTSPGRLSGKKDDTVCRLIYLVGIE